MLIIMCQAFDINGQDLNHADYISLEDGLPTNRVLSTNFDSKGFVWISTLNGFSRYDGESFLNYYPDLEKEGGLKNRRIEEVIERSDGKFWILSAFCLCVFDPIAETFTPTSLCFNDEQVGVVEFFDMVVDNDNTIWISGVGGLFEYDPIQNKYINYPVKKGLRNAREHHSRNVIQSIYIHENPNLLWTNNKSNMIFNKRNKSFEKHKIESSPNFHILSSFTFLGKYLIGLTWHQGVIQCDLNTGECVQSFFQGDPKNVFVHAHVKNDSIIYVGSFLHGVLEYNVNTQKFTKCYLSNQNEKYKDYNFIGDITQDSFGQIWISTWDGLLRDNDQKPFFEPISLAHYYLENDSYAAVIRGITRIDENSYLVITNKPDFAFKYDSILKAFTKVPIKKGENSKPFRTSTYLAFTDSQGEIWISNYEMYRYNRKRKQIEIFKEKEFDELFGKTLAFDVIETPDTDLYFATLNKGLMHYNRSEDRFYKYYSDEDENIPDQKERIIHISLTSKGILYISTGSYGIYKYDYKNKKWLDKITKLKPQDKIPQNKIICYLEYKEGQYLVHNDFSLLLIDENGNFIKEIKNSEGKTFDPIQAVERLPDGRVIIISVSGMHILYQDGSIKSYGLNAGITDLEGWSTALRVIGESEIFIGKKNSTFHIIDIDQIPENKTIPRIELTGLKILNDSSSIYINPTYLDEIELTFDQNYLTINYAALNFTNSTQNRYKYKMSGLQEGWIDAGTDNFATFTNLAPGIYTFSVKGSNNDGVWNNDARSLKIEIQPPWFRSWWAYLIYTIVSLWALFMLWSFQKRRKRLKRELAYKENEAKRLLELDTFKNKFYTNLTHEFRTPLTIISGMAKSLETNDKEKSLILRNSDNLLSLVNQLLDLSKSEAGKLLIANRETNIVRLINNTKDSFEFLAREKNNAIIFDSEYEELIVWIDEKKLITILNNLLSNAIKFSSSNNAIQMSLTKLDESTIRIQIADKGIGIAPQNIENIFDSFFQIDSSNSRAYEGTGVGLSIVKKYVEVMNGSIEVESELGQGTTFSITLPFESSGPRRNQNIKNSTRHKLLNIFEDEDIDEIEDNKKPIILVVEDNADMRYYIKKLLSSKYKILTSENGLLGLNQAISSVPDVIITDVMMPKMTGIEFCAKLKENISTSHIPVIMLTAKVGIENKVEGIKVGANAYITKPFQEIELFATITQLLDQQKILNQNIRSLPTEIIEIPSLEKTFISEVIDNINSHIADSQFGVEQLASEVGLERTQLYRKLKAISGQSPANMIKEMRMELAKKMIINDCNVNISEIAFSCGFSEASYFSKVYKKWWGISPSEERLKSD